jgi:hypothetical protein
MYSTARAGYIYIWVQLWEEEEEVYYTDAVPQLEQSVYYI